MNRPSIYLDSLIKEFSKLPGIGPKSASRLAFHILGQPYDAAVSLSMAIIEMKKNIITCSVCGGISDKDMCSICSDDMREGGIICIVESPKDVLTIEGTGGYNGLYHVINGLISPLDGIGPDDLNIASLVERCGQGLISEAVLALNPTVEGDATSLYLARLIGPIGIKVTRIAHGLPVGADLEFIDSATIIKSLEGRVVM